MRCVVCGSNKFKVLFKKHIHNKTYSFEICKDCGFRTVEPYPSKKELDNFFRTGYDYSYMENFNSRVKRITYRRLRFLLKFVNNGSLLEIGCGSGNFLNISKKYFDVTGIEISKKAADIGGKNFGIKILNTDFYDFKPKKKFDVIALFHVLEHLLEPKDAMKKIGSLLDDEGYVYIIVPNIDSLNAKLFGKHSEWINPPKHLSYFNRKTIKQFLENNRFKIVKIRTRRGDDYNFLFGSLLYLIGLFGLRQKLMRNTVNDKDKSGSYLGLYEIIFKITNVLVLPFYPLRWLIEQFGYGSEMVIIAKKKEN